jgi:hypothetical protein
MPQPTSASRMQCQPRHHRGCSQMAACARRCARQLAASRLSVKLVYVANVKKLSHLSPVAFPNQRSTQSHPASQVATPPLSHPTAAIEASISSASKPGHPSAAPATRQQPRRTSRITEQLSSTPSRVLVPGPFAASYDGEDGGPPEKTFEPFPASTRKAAAMRVFAGGHPSSPHAFSPGDARRPFYDARYE